MRWIATLPTRSVIAMDILETHPARKWTILASLLLLQYAPGAFAQYVALTARIETVLWGPDEIQTWDRTVRCVVGTNTWFIVEPGGGTQKHAWSFDATNLVCQTLVTGYPSRDPALYERNHPEAKGSIGRRFTNTAAFPDRNPFRPVRQADVPWALDTKISWLAFCSGSLLRSEGRRLYPVSDLWKQFLAAPPAGFSERCTVFEDALGLPNRLELSTTNAQPVFQYSVRLSTNILGRTFPLEFHLAQYQPVGPTGWTVSLTAKGTVTALGTRTEPTLPLERDGNAGE